MSERLLIVSADGHIGGRPEEYRPYFDAAHRDAVDDLVQWTAHWTKVTGDEELARDPDFLGWNLKSRLAALDAEGIVAEVAHPGPQGTALPFFTCAYKPCSAELRWAGARAYNRWLADQLDASGGRLLGVAGLGPCFDIEQAKAEIRYVAERGFVAVEVPQCTYDSALPPIHDPYYEPIWALVEELGLRLALHAGWGVPQERFWEFGAIFAELTGQSKEKLRERASDEMMAKMGDMMSQIMEPADPSLDLAWAPRRALWQLMVAGVFDRYPNLTLVITELRADWIPPMLAELDLRFAEARPPVKLKPSDYWARNCYATPSSIRPSELALRRELGVDRVMFGTDSPHREGTWPQTLAWIRHAFKGVPLDEAKAILGGNAIRCYGLDPKPLEAMAAKIGPTASEILDGGAVDPALIKAFDDRSGISRPAEVVNTDAVRKFFAEDMAALA